MNMIKYSTRVLKFIFIHLAIVGCFESNDIRSTSNLTAENPNLDSLSNHSTSENFTMDLIQDGLLKMKLSGKVAEHYTSKELNETKIMGPVLFTVFDSAGDTTIVGDANQAIYQGDQAIFIMIGEVHVNSDNSRRLYTPDTLVWDQQSDEISTNNFLIIVTPEDSISGYGLIGNSDLTNYRIKNISGKTAIDD